MASVRSLKSQITKLLKKNGFKPSVPNKTRPLKSVHGLVMYDQGFEYKKVPFQDDCFYLDYYPGVFSTRISDEQKQNKVNGMLAVLQASSLPAEFTVVDKKILVRLATDGEEA